MKSPALNPKTPKPSLTPSARSSGPNSAALDLRQPDAEHDGPPHHGFRVYSALRHKASLNSVILSVPSLLTGKTHRELLQPSVNLCELKSKLLLSPLISAVILPYITPFKESRL